MLGTHLSILELLCCLDSLTSFLSVVNKANQNLSYQKSFVEPSVICHLNNLCKFVRHSYKCIRKSELQ